MTEPPGPQEFSVGVFKFNLDVILGCERLGFNTDDAVNSGRKAMFTPINVEKYRI
jgi:hypothetical protein